MVDDAMEGGKLSPMHLRGDHIKAPIRHPRRFSIAGSPHNVSIRNEIRSRCVELPTSSHGSISSTSSGGSDNNPYHNVICGRKFPSLGNATSSFMKNSNNLSDFSQSFPGFSRQLSDPHSKSENTTPNTVEINKSHLVKKIVSLLSTHVEHVTSAALESHKYERLREF